MHGAGKALLGQSFPSLLSLQALLLGLDTLKKLTEGPVAGPQATEQTGSLWAFYKFGLLLSRGGW